MLHRASHAAWPSRRHDRVSKNSWVLFSPYVMGRLEALWGADAAQFDPERHLGKSKPSSFVFTAFQARGSGEGGGGKARGWCDV